MHKSFSLANGSWVQSLGFDMSNLHDWSWTSSAHLLWQKVRCACASRRAQRSARVECMTSESCSLPEVVSLYLQFLAFRKFPENVTYISDYWSCLPPWFFFFVSEISCFQEISWKSDIYLWLLELTSMKWLPVIVPSFFSAESKLAARSLSESESWMQWVMTKHSMAGMWRLGACRSLKPDTAWSVSLLSRYGFSTSSWKSRIRNKIIVLFL